MEHLFKMNNEQIIRFNLFSAFRDLRNGLSSIGKTKKKRVICKSLNPPDNIVRADILNDLCIKEKKMLHEHMDPQALIKYLATPLTKQERFEYFFLKKAKYLNSKTI